MILKEIHINGFKNIAEASLCFSPKVNALLGNNGMGKSNLLDAIYFLSFCKSFSGMTDAQIIRRGDDFAMVRATYLRHGIDEQLSLGITPGRRKSLKRQGKEYQRLSAHIGAFPLVMSSPQDVDIIRGSSDERRRLMDMVISQTDPVYLDALIRYGRALDQRNRMLRDGIADTSLYAAVEMQMDIAASAIHQSRAAWTERLTSIFSRYYSAIAGDGAEQVELRYDSSLNSGATLSSLLDSARRRDEAVRHTSVGPHRDDLEMLIDGMPMRRAASQGQCKTYAIALRLAQYDFLRENVGMRPLLLLDDIFDKLDATRVERIMELVAGAGFGQIFITDTNRTHLDGIIRRTGSDYSLWNVDSGGIFPSLKLIIAMKRTDPKSVNQIIDEYLSHEGLTATVDEQRAAYLWPEVVGHVINRYTTRRYVDKGVLHVYISSAPLKQELSFCRERLTADINAAIGRPVLTGIVIH